MVGLRLPAVPDAKILRELRRMYLDGQKCQLRAWVAQGVSDAEIARRVNVSASTVRYWRERNGVKRPASRKPSKRVFKQTRPLRGK